MKKLILITSIASISFFVIGYLVGNFVPFRDSCDSSDNVEENTNDTTDTNEGQTPESKGILEVTVKDSANKAMVGIEIDVNYTPGQPQSWGIAEADVDGSATYELDPGDYVIYFNSNRFPSGYRMPDTQSVTIQAGETSQVTIILQKL